MDLHLHSKVALVAGGSRGIGRHIADALAREGATLALCARDEETLEKAAGEIRETGAEVLAIPADITDPDAGRRVVTATVERFGRLDILVGNAGGNRRGKFIDTGDDDWREIVDLNVLSHLRFARAAVPAMKEHDGGVLLFVASIFGREAGGPGLSIYTATKSALISAAKIMALELAPDGIRVLTVAPGSIRFPGGSWDQRCLDDPEGMKKFVEANLPIGRFGSAEEVADAVAFLVSDRASLITAACVNVDGGQSRSLI